MEGNPWNDPPGPTPSEVIAMPGRFAALDAFILDKMGQTHLPGVSLALLAGDDVVHQRGYGFRDLKDGLPATPETLYAIGSVTKSFTCLALMQLQEQGKLSVDDPVDRHLPLAIRPFGQPIRLWHLMTHTSGIPALAYAEAVLSREHGSTEKWLPIAGLDDLLTFMDGAEDWGETRPGERWFYLNEGYVLLGEIIERVSGLPYRDYVRRHILEPLGMRRSAFDRATVENDADVATPHLITSDGEPLPSRYSFGRILADGGLISNVPDLLRYLRMFLLGGRASSGDARIAAGASIQAMMEGRVGLPATGWLQSGDAPAILHQPGTYGYGLHAYPDFFGHRLVGHGGSVGVATAYIGFIPARDVAVAVLANGAGYAAGQLGMAALATLLGEDPERLPFLRIERLLDGLAGVYETFKGTMQVTFRRKGDLLQAEFRDKHHQENVPLIPEVLDGDAPRFFTLAAGRRSTVEFNRKGDAIEVLYERYKLRRIGPA
jgi:CubicO group peptidase (beta-lactamase class C family)